MIDKKTIWITGGSTGIGKALAIKFAKEGPSKKNTRRHMEIHEIQEFH